jgi:hypothetical protein
MHTMMIFLLILKGVPGTEDIKKEAVEKLAKFWKNRCGIAPKSGKSA